MNNAFRRTFLMDHVIATVDTNVSQAGYNEIP